MSKGKLIFLATEDWFVRSHFLPLLRRARDDGFEVIVAARTSGALADEPGVRVIAMPFARGSLAPHILWREAQAVRALLAEEKPAIVHAIALRAIQILLMAGKTDAARAFALTGRGFIGVSRAPWAMAAAALLRRGLRAGVAEGGVLLVENPADRAWVENGAPLPDARVVQMPGAGVDIGAYAPLPEPDGPIVVGMVGRLVRSKGADVAVAALQRVRAAGHEIALHIAGDADADNPHAVTQAEIAAWRALPGVVLHGRITDVIGFWRGAHIACAPSRGGEGLPRVLLEAAACARPLVATATPGCADFVRDGETGLLVPEADDEALASAWLKLAQDGPMRARMGAAARARVAAHHTEAHAADCAAQAWARLRV